MSCCAARVRYSRLLAALTRPSISDVATSPAAVCSCCVGVLSSTLHEEIIADVRRQVLARLVASHTRFVGCRVVTRQSPVASNAEGSSLIGHVLRLRARLFSNYDATDFALKIKLPSVVLLREYSLLQHLRRSVGSFPSRVPVDLKETLKVRSPPAPLSGGLS